MKALIEPIELAAAFVLYFFFTLELAVFVGRGALIWWLVVVTYMRTIIITNQLTR